MLSVAIFASLFAVTFSAAVKGNSDLLVQTSIGALQGHYNEVGIREWKGIPYAKPPVGDLRWEYPQPPTPFTSVYEANVNVAGCQQVCKLPPGNCPEYGISEDCLYLSVFAPKEASKKPEGYPVHFWIHGGAFEQGLGNCALYNGSTFAQQGIISVVINYRLGALGFLASPSQKGNYGFVDQRTALQWTKDNIAGFGGDPNRITIAGQSAGAMSVGAHLLSPKSKDLFQGSVMESNPLGLPFHDRESAAANAKSVFEYLNCAEDDVACMKTKTPEEVLDAQEHAIKLNLQNLLINFLPFAPMVEASGEAEIPVQPMDGLAQGKWQTVTPLLAGSLLDEGQLFVYELFTKPLGKTAYGTIIDVTFGLRNAKQIKQKYPFDLIPGNEDGREVLNVLATDLLFLCPLRNVSRGALHTLPQKPPVYAYRFKHVESFDCWGENYTFCVGWCCHGSELPYVFNVFTDGKDITYTPTGEEKVLTSDLGNAWANFIQTGSPNLGGRSIPLEYPLYDAVKDTLLVQDEPDYSLQSNVRSEYCDLWDRLGYYY